MAALIKLGQISVIQSFTRRYFLSQMIGRNINTSPKKTAGDAGAECCQPIDPCQPKDNWVSYGFDYNSKEEDTNVHNASFFFSVTLCLVFGGFMWAYAPDTHLRDWAQREAFLELRRREKAGCLPIDPNYVDPSSVQIPSDDELCDVEIVI